jgi:hypothetical protein
MTHQDCPGALQVEMQYVSDGQNIFNVFHVAKESGASLWGGTQIANILGVFSDWWETDLRPLMPPQLVFQQVVGTDLTSLSGLKLVNTIHAGQAGTNADDSAANNVTLAFKLAVATRGRGASGRSFWPAIPNTKVIHDKIDDTYIADAIAAFGALVAALGDATPPSLLVVLSRFKDGSLRPDGVVLPVVDILVTDQYVDSQKLRLPRHRKAKRRHLIP